MKHYCARVHFATLVVLSPEIQVGTKAELQAVEGCLGQEAGKQGSAG